MFKIYEDSEGVVLVEVEVKLVFGDGKFELKFGVVVVEWLERVLFLLLLLLYVFFGEFYFLEKLFV